jgi:hypothetical protein
MSEQNNGLPVNDYQTGGWKAHWIFIFLIPIIGIFAVMS